MVFAVLAGRLLRFRRTDLRSPDVRHRYVGDAGLWLPAVHTGLCRTRLRHIALSSVRSGRMVGADNGVAIVAVPARRSEEHTSELQSLMRISYAVFCLKKKNKLHNIIYRSSQQPSISQYHIYK